MSKVVLLILFMICVAFTGSCKQLTSVPSVVVCEMKFSHEPRLIFHQLVTLESAQTQVSWPCSTYHISFQQQDMINKLAGVAMDKTFLVTFEFMGNDRKIIDIKRKL